MNGLGKSNMKGNRFCNISSASDLVLYLKESQRFNNIKTICKYTNITSVGNLFSTGNMLLNSPANMNDLYEYKAFGQNINKWEKICFTSFITKSDESMAMWSMYAQPWTEGVMISIPMSIFKEIVRNTKSLICAEYNKNTDQYFPRNNEISAKGILSVSRVAYSNGPVISCTGRNDRNKHFKNPYALPELMGYIKDSAWDYEKEIRLRADLPESYESNAIFLKIPEKYLRHFSIVAGPRFAGNILTVLPEQYRRSVKIEISKFKEKIARVPCDNCSKKDSLRKGRKRNRNEN